jgi:signal transduction histidine kinase
MSLVRASPARIRAFWAWLPVIALPPVLILDAALNGEKDVTVLGVLSAYVACLPLVFRSRMRFALMAPVLTGSVVLVLSLLGSGNTVVLIPAVALAELATRSDRRYLIWVAIAVVPCVGVSVVAFADNAGDFFSILLRNVAYCWLALAAGDAVRSRREAVERTAAAAEEESLRRLSDERLRIARDVHDVVAHAMTEINVQAGVAAHLIDHDPEQARSALRNIKRASGDALTDLRGTLGVLRGTEGRAPVEPTGGREPLDELAAGLRAAGVQVTVDVDELPPGASAVRTAAYRIVQEALTNVLRHAGATAAQVRVGFDGEQVAIDVRDDGTGGMANGGSGQGIRGMRERATALGGTLESGPAPDGGWRVSARLPVEVETAT